LPFPLRIELLTALTAMVFATVVSEGSDRVKTVARDGIIAGSVPLVAE